MRLCVTVANRNCLLQTWSEGYGNDLPSYCGPPDSAFASKNVKHITIPGTSLSWPSRHARNRDHSKWAVTAPSNGSAGTCSFCIADQNRARSQEVRGGSTICFIDNVDLWRAFTGIIDSVEECSADLAAQPPYPEFIPPRRYILSKQSG